jgi:hypothetical protein
MAFRIRVAIAAIVVAVVPVKSECVVSKLWCPLSEVTQLEILRVEPANNALLSDAPSSLRCAYGAAKRGR